MSDVSERKPFTIYNLVSAVEEYIATARHSRDAVDRCFASALEEDVLPKARRIRSGGLDDDEKKVVAEFRYREIMKEIGGKQAEITRLESEAKQLGVGRS